MNSEVKNIIYLLVGIFVWTIVVWFTSKHLDSLQWEKRLADAKTTDTLIVHDTTIVFKETHKTVVNKPTITRDRRSVADSAFDAGMQKGLDSMRLQYEMDTAIEDTTVFITRESDTIETLGALHHSYDPISKIANYDFFPFSKKETQKEIVRTVYVQVPEESPWWKYPAIILGGAVVGYEVHNLVK